MTYDCVKILVRNWINKQQFNEYPSISNCVKIFLSDKKYNVITNDKLVVDLIPCIMGIELLQKFSQ